MQDDPDARFAEILRRVWHLRRELGEGAYARCVAALMHSLGVAAMAEAEVRARTLAVKDAPTARGVNVVPFAQRRVDDGCHEGFDP